MRIKEVFCFLIINSCLILRLPMRIYFTTHMISDLLDFLYDYIFSAFSSANIR